MSALVKPCSTSRKPKNTGWECGTAMEATAGLFMIPLTDTWLASDEVDFDAFVLGRIHATPENRWYPIFGKYAPVNGITDSKENDVVETMDDGSMAFVRNGMYGRTFMTKEGGICLAKAMATFHRKRWAFVEVDKDNKVIRKVSADGITRSGIPSNLAYGQTPELANLKTVYKNAFLINFDPAEYIGKGEIMASQGDLTSLLGLTDAKITLAAAATTTKLKIGVETICKGTDLVAKYGATLAAVGNFIVTNKATGVVIVCSAAAVVSGHIELTGVFVSASIYNVVLAAPSVLLAASVSGYEQGDDGLDITIP
jgi:hypothetical protein